MSDPVGVVFRPGDALDRRGPVRIEHLLAVPLILDPQYSVRILVDRAFESIGRSVTPAFEVSYVPTALGLGRAGLGVAILALSAHEAAPLGGLRARPMVHPLLVRRISLIESVQRSLSPAGQQFVAAWHATCRQRRPASTTAARGRAAARAR